jgi:tetratricopeptide (TPR) repeat protein
MKYRFYTFLFIKLLVMTSCNTYSRVESLTMSWEMGNLDLNNISRDSIDTDEYNYLKFMRSYIYGVNLNTCDLLSEAKSRIKDTNSTWFLTLRYIEHAEKDLFSKLQDSFLTLAQQTTDSEKNVYLKLFKLNEKLDSVCDLSIAEEILSEVSKDLKQTNYFKVLASTCFSKYDKYETALKYVEQITYKGNADLGAMQVALVHSQIGDYETFEGYVSKFEKITGNKNLFLYTLSFNSYSDRNRYESTKLLKKYDSIFLKNYLYYTTKGYMHINKQEWDDAMKYFDSAYRCDPIINNLYDYVWLSLSMRKYENLSTIFEDDSLSEWDWLNGYFLVYLMRDPMIVL